MLGHFFRPLDPFLFSTRGPWTGYWCEAARIFQNCESFLFEVTIHFAIFMIEKLTH